MANNQVPKFIDVSRTYLPGDPEAFPENLLTGPAESSGEGKTPIMAYYGRNFLGTSYGYKSYFGLNQKVNIDDLAARVDFVFIYQNQQFDNILVALCDSGIWIKKGTTTGAWIQSKAYAVDPNPAVHRDWTYTTASNILYCYQQGRGEYQKISSQLADPGVALVDVVPTFLNMTGQMGIFKASGRLGFWDSANSISWSSLDDYQDFTPSLQTLAGFSIFQAVKGRIVTIQSHGDGWIVYATKSIVYVNPEPTQTYQWQPVEVLNNSGIAYSRQCCAATPDSTHFAWTSTGLYKIQFAKPELIVPNITDFIREDNIPVYLRVLEGRYLFIEILDPEFLQGQVAFTEGTVDDLFYYFPGIQKTLLDAVAESTLTGTSICQAIHNYGQFSDQLPAKPGDMKPNTFFQPVYTAYLSRRGSPAAADITWGTAPCAATDVNGVALSMNPNGTAHKLSSMTTDSTNKTAVSGTDAYIDGKWTIERFIAAQTAIWEMEQEGLNAYLSALTNKSSFTDKTTLEQILCANTETPTECTIGRYVTAYSGAQFGFSKCSFWLTRYAIAAADIKNRRVYKKSCTPIAAKSEIPLSIFYAQNGGCPGTGTQFPSMAANCAARGLPEVCGVTGQQYYVCCPTGNCSSGSCTGALQGCPVCRSSPLQIATTAPGGIFSCNYQAGFDVYESVACYNKRVDVEIAPTPETAFCTLTGWKYTKNDNTEGFIAASACSEPAAFQQDDENQPWIKPADKDGEFCSIPFTPVTIPGTPAVVVNWPDESLTIPGGTFLLQAGSAAPVYPTKFGAIVYDLQLKKWGNMQQTYKELIDYSPINSEGNGVVSYSAFGMKGGVITINGTVRLFDSAPVDSYIAYGKLGYNRLGFTDVEEVRVDFREPSTGTLEIHSSENGRSLASGWVISYPFEDAKQAHAYGAYSGRWHDIIVRGIYDISYIEYRGLNQGKR